MREKAAIYFVIKNDLLREFLSELLGTFVFMSFALASVAQYKFKGSSTFLSANISFGFGLTFGIIISGKVSGKNHNYLKLLFYYYNVISLNFRRSFKSCCFFFHASFRPNLIAALFCLYFSTKHRLIFSCSDGLFNLSI